MHNALRCIVLGEKPCSVMIVPRAQGSDLRAWQHTRVADTIRETPHRLPCRMTCNEPDGTSIYRQCLACCFTLRTLSAACTTYLYDGTHVLVRQRTLERLLAM